MFFFGSARSIKIVLFFGRFVTPGLRSTQTPLHGLRRDRSIKKTNPPGFFFSLHPPFSFSLALLLLGLSEIFHRFTAVAF